MQSFTYTFAAERRPDGERHVIPEPEKYRHYRAAQPYSLTIDVHGGEIYGEESGRLEYRLYDRMPGTKGGLWTYRRLLAADLVRAAVRTHDLTLFNWPGNDYRDRSIIDRPAAEAAASLQDAKRVSLGFLHWLQTEAPTTGDATRRAGDHAAARRDGHGRRPLEASLHPRVAPHRRAEDDRRGRTCRRISSRARVAAPSPTRSASAGTRSTSTAPATTTSASSCRTKPFQIPLGALIPVRIVNLIAAAKNIGTHPHHERLLPAASGRMEHRRGGRRAGGVRAAARLSPAAVRAERLAPFQHSLRDEGVPLAWPESLR